MELALAPVLGAAAAQRMPLRLALAEMVECLVVAVEALVRV
jgi:hypothetical protein